MKLSGKQVKSSPRAVHQLHCLTRPAACRPFVREVRTGCEPCEPRNRSPHTVVTDILYAIGADGMTAVIDEMLVGVRLP